MYLLSSHSTGVLIFFLLTWHLYSARHLYSAFQLCILSEVRLLNFLRLLLLLLLPPLQAPPLLVYGMQHAACHMRLISPTVWGLRWCNFWEDFPFKLTNTISTRWLKAPKCCRWGDSQCWSYGSAGAASSFRPMMGQGKFGTKSCSKSDLDRRI